MIRPNSAVQAAAFSAIESLEDRKLFSTVVGISGRDLLVFFDSATPDTTLAKVKVKGLARGESLLALDFRPANGQLYAVGDTNQLYRIAPTTGQATAVGVAFGSPADGVDFGFDFNPAVDRARIVTDADDNFRVNPDDGTLVDFDPGTDGVQSDLALNYATGDVNFGDNPSVVGAAYTNNVASGTPTTLYALDSDNNVLVTVGSVDGTPVSPNSGSLATIGGLGVDFTEVARFDIETSGGINTAYASLATAATGRSTLFTVNLATGAATAVGEIRSSKAPVTGITVVPTGQKILALNANNRFYAIDAVLPNIRSAPVKISGLDKREKIISIDQRPLDGVLYAFSNQNRVYTINATTGAATAAGSQNTVTVNKKAKLDMDFNPSVDRFRVVNTAGENVRYNPVGGQVEDADPVAADVQFDGPIVYSSTDVNAAASPNVTGIAYGTNVAATPTTTLFAIDTTQDVLVTIGTADGSTSPNTGQLFTVGALGVDVKDVTQFDIVTTNSVDTGLAVMKQGSGGQQLFSIDLATGTATSLGKLARGVRPIGMAIQFPVVV